MRKIAFIFSLLSGVFLSNVSLAEEGGAKLSLTDGIVLDKENTEEEPQDLLFSNFAEENIAQAEEEQEEKGLFSFLNFSFFKDEKVKSVEPKDEETHEDFMTRVERLADEGDINALLTLGYMYLYGLNDVEMNYKKAYNYYLKAAEQGDSIAINNLGSMYHGGVGVKKDIKKAAELYAEASDLGHVEASLNLAIIYLNEQSLRNEEEAIKLLKFVAEKDNPTGIYLLGYAYLKGIGVPQNKKKAVQNIRKAADKGYDEAQYLLGFLYMQGWGVPQNYNNALKFLNMSMAQGNISAINLLGEIYASGNRIEPDFYKAYIMYNIAAYYGVPKADEKRDILADKKLKKPEVLQAQAEAENYKPNPSNLTKYIRLTFGDSLAFYVDPEAPVVHVEEE